MYVYFGKFLKKKKRVILIYNNTVKNNINTKNYQRIKKISWNIFHLFEKKYTN